ncbi:MAG: hypothetical protein IJL49_04690 [Firmicutes bacterium]|nr:hypothetical protein [Bacillota bacterium]
MDIKGKKIMFLGGSGLDACAVKRAKELGLTTIVANWYDVDRAPAKAIADEAWKVDFSNTENMVKLIKENHVDGIFVGWTDSHLQHYVDICNKAGLPCCGTAEQFEVLSNNKKKFKEICIKHNIPVVKDYKMSIDFSPEDLFHVVYPVIVKPADGSGGRGVKCCLNEKELIDHYRYLYDNNGPNIICEKYIDTKREIFLNYTIIDSEAHLAASYMSFNSKRDDGKDGPAILHVYPSSYTKQYQETVEPQVINMIKDIGLKNCVLSLQGFVLDDGFVFHETGLRMGGGQSYVFTKLLNGVSALDQMLEFTVTGKVSQYNCKNSDNPYFSKYGVNYYISLKTGKIQEISGVEEVNDMPQVIQMSTYHKIGDEIIEGSSLDSVIYRLHVMDDTPQDLARTLEKISNTFCIRDQNGNEMQVERLTYDRALEMISNS